MSPSDLETIFAEYPDKPIRLTLSSGDSFVVPSASHAVIEAFSMSLRVFSFDDISRRVGKTVKFVSLPNIASAEVLNSLPPENSRRRRR
jgi:hypothetical protein